LLLWCFYLPTYEEQTRLFNYPINRRQLDNEKYFTVLASMYSRCKEKNSQVNIGYHNPNLAVVQMPNKFLVKLEKVEKLQIFLRKWSQEDLKDNSKKI